MYGISHEMQLVILLQRYIKYNLDLPLINQSLTSLWAQSLPTATIERTHLVVGIEVVIW